jgi:hypothetical protein
MHVMLLRHLVGPVTYVSTLLVLLSTAPSHKRPQNLCQMRCQNLCQMLCRDLCQMLCYNSVGLGGWEAVS